MLPAPTPTQQSFIWGYYCDASVWFGGLGGVLGRMERCVVGAIPIRRDVLWVQFPSVNQHCEEVVRLFTMGVVDAGWFGIM